MSEFLKRTWAEIHLDRLQGNFQAIQASLAPGSQAMAVVKADGYGHGAAAAAKALRQAGAAWFGVSNLEEAVQLRRAGIDGDILILSFTPPEEAGRLAEFAVTQTVLSRPYAEELDAAAQAAGVRVRVHLKVDTGMSRVGFLYHREGDEAVLDDMAAACRLPHLTAEGIFTHFASADEEEDEGFTRRQFALFMDAVRRLEERGVSFALRHCCNSAATLRYPEMHLDMVRPGIILYGLSPAPWMEGMLPLDPVMELKTTVSMIKDLPADTPVSYGRIYTTGEARRVATVPIGYADGYPRVLSNRADMLLAGRRVRVVGRVCMDQCMLDVTGLDVRESMVATVFGRDGEAFLPVEELADHMGTINYEVVCQISKRVPRLFVRDGQVVGQLNYIVSP
ncbi:MAG: alanine racemase [Oscillospiraceae bacterium]|nr:alanine racemase [Oscillospiraceae bacterium]